MLSKMAKALTRKPDLVIIIAVLLLIPSLFGVISTAINYDILSYLPQDLDSTQGERILEDTFHNAATSMLVIEDMSSKDVLALKEKIEQVSGINDVIWVSDITDISVPESILPSTLKNIFYSEKTNSTLLLIKFDGSSSSDSTMTAISDIRGYLNDNCYLSGMSAVNKDVSYVIDKEFPIYILMAVLLCLVVMTLLMDSWLLPPILLSGIGFAIAYNFGTNIFLGEISFVSKSIAAILQLGVTMDFSIFLVNRYDEEKTKFTDNRDAMAKAIETTFVSIIGSSLTAFAGFMALCFMDLTLGKDIGIVMGKGILLGVLTTITVLPSLLLKFDKPIHKYKHKSFMPNFSRITNFTTKHYRIFIAVFILTFIPAFYLQSQTEIYYNLYDSLPDYLDSMQATDKLKNDYNMATTNFIIVDDSLASKDMKSMIDQIKKLDGVKDVLAYDDFIGPAIPDSFIPQEIKDICKKDGMQIMMVNSEYSAASDPSNEQITSMNEIVKKYDINAKITGEGALMGDLVEIAGHDFKVTSYLSMLMILVILAIIFHSLTIPIILVASIELAIFLNIGCSYLTGTVIPFISPTVIDCVQLGSCINYAILITTRFREELRNGLDRVEAIKVAANTSARAIITSAAVFFCACIGVAMISDIDFIYSICAMLARGALISTIVIIFLLSAILLKAEPLINKTTYHWKKKKETIDEEIFDDLEVNHG